LAAIHYTHIKMPPTPTSPDRVAGILLGLAAGDRNGGPIQMATRLAESLMRYGKFELDDIGLRYLDWWKNGAFDTGPVAAQVLELVDSGISFADASETVHAETAGFTAGSNPAHRISPVAMLHALPDSELPQVAKAEADLTHRHPLAGDVSAAVACLCRALIRGHDWPAACNEARNGRMQETIHALAAR